VNNTDVEAPNPGFKP